ncbi:MAG TPA: sugar phosphate nucleotidyltransferase [bacterium]|nr:sugar phosphate nucleotidyltransferase [bacterium]
MSGNGKVKKCVIPAAGRGDRISELGINTPKLLLPVANRPLVEYHLEIIQSAGIKEVVFILSSSDYISDIKKATGDTFNCEFIIQKQPRGIADSLGKAKNALDSPFLVILGDIYLTPRNIGKQISVFENSDNDALIFIRENEPPESVKKSFEVSLNKDGTVKKVREKPGTPKNSTRGCGLYIFKESIFNIIEETPLSDTRGEHELTDSIQMLINKGGKVAVAVTGDLDININSPQDLLLSNLHQINTTGKSIISSDSDIHPDTEIIRSVIGSKVKIKNAVKIQNSLLWEGSSLTGFKDVENSIVLGEKVFYFPNLQF